jgi:hypothetical protein
MYATLHCFQSLDKFTQAKENQRNLQTQLAKTQAGALVLFLTLNDGQGRRSRLDDLTFERNHTPQIPFSKNLSEVVSPNENLNDP